MNRLRDAAAAELAAAELRLREINAMPNRWGDRALHEEELVLERRIAALKGEEYAEPIAFPVEWCAGAPIPQMLCNESCVLLGFRQNSPPLPGDPIPRGINPTSPRAEQMALVTFRSYAAVKLGAPNDEVLNGHPLWGRGAEFYAAQRVINSRWIADLQRINSVHDRYDPRRWTDLQHFIFWFHDSTFECIADGYTVETHTVSFRELLGIMTDRPFARP